MTVSSFARKRVLSTGNLLKQASLATDAEPERGSTEHAKQCETYARPLPFCFSRTGRSRSDEHRDRPLCNGIGILRVPSHILTPLDANRLVEGCQGLTIMDGTGSTFGLVVCVEPCSTCLHEVNGHMFKDMLYKCAQPGSMMKWGKLLRGAEENFSKHTCPYTRQPFMHPNHRPRSALESTSNASWAGWIRRANII